MPKVNISSPWDTYAKKLKALFAEDPDIDVEEVSPVSNEDYDYAINIKVFKHDKYLALSAVLPYTIEFGNVKVRNLIYDVENDTNGEDVSFIFKTLFNGNPIVSDFKDVPDFTGNAQHFMLFKPEVIQFFNDDISDFNGNYNGLAQDIAREVFKDCMPNIHFCTDVKK